VESMAAHHTAGQGTHRLRGGLVRWAQGGFRIASASQRLAAQPAQHQQARGGDPAADHPQAQGQPAGMGWVQRHQQQGRAHRDRRSQLHLYEGGARVCRRHKNDKRERDPEMHQTKKGNQWYHRCAEGFAYAMKVHIGVDKVTGLIRSVETTAVNVHDLTPAADLLHGEVKVVYADAGYQGIEKNAKMVGRSSGFRVAISTG